MHGVRKSQQTEMMRITILWRFFGNPKQLKVAYLRPTLAIISAL